MTVTPLYVGTTMSSQYKVDKMKKNKYPIKPTQLRGQVSDMIPKFGTMLLLLVPN